MSPNLQNFEQLLQKTFFDLMTFFNTWFLHFFKKGLKRCSEKNFWVKKIKISSTCPYSLDKSFYTIFGLFQGWSVFRPFPLLLKGVFTIFDVEHMLNGAISNFTPSKDFLIRSSVRPTGPKTWCSKALRGLGSRKIPLFPLSLPYRVPQQI